MWDTRKSIQMAVFVGNMMINDGILGYSILYEKTGGDSQLAPNNQWQPFVP